MKNVLVKAGLIGTVLLASFASHAAVYTCKGFVTDVRAVSGGSFKVSQERSDGVFLGGAFIRPDRTYLLGPALQAEADANNGIEYILVLENEGSDTRCKDHNEGPGDLIGLTPAS